MSLLLLCPIMALVLVVRSRPLRLHSFLFLLQTFVNIFVDNTLTDRSRLHVRHDDQRTPKGRDCGLTHSYSTEASAGAKP